MNDRTATLRENSISVHKNISTGCPQGSCASPGYWNIQYNSLLNLDYSVHTKSIAFADDFLLIINGKSPLELEIYANMELSKVERWAKQNKITFNLEKSKLLVISRRKRQCTRNLNIFLNNGALQESETLTYLGITIDRKFNFHQHIENITQKCIKLIYALSKSAKISWGLNQDVIRTIYKGAILPIISYGVPVWIEAINNQHNARKLQRVQRLINIRIAKSFRTTSHEALCVITKNTPIVLELQKIAAYYQIKKPNNMETKVHAVRPYTSWTHPAEMHVMKGKKDNMAYTFEIYTDGSKGDTGVGAGIAVYKNKEINCQLQ